MVPHLPSLYFLLQDEVQLVLTMGGHGGRQVPLTVRPADPRFLPSPSPSSGGGARAAAAGSGAGQGLEVQLPHRILYVRDAGGSTAQLVRAEVDGAPVSLQVLASGPRQLKLQHCGAHRLVQVRVVVVGWNARGGE